MALRRNRNVDDANRGLVVETVWGDAPDDEVTMGIADAGSIYEMLSDLSAEPGAYVLREAWSNAYDATRRAGTPYKPVEIRIDTGGDPKTITGKLNAKSDNVPHISVTDHGCGMSADDVRRLFLQYGGSDKRDEIDAVGSKGLGSKAPLAIADTFVVTTTKDGVTTTAVIEKRAGTANVAYVNSERTDAENGTRVDIPVAKRGVLKQAMDMADRIAKFATDVPVRVNGREPSETLPLEIGAESAGFVFAGTMPLMTDDGDVDVRVWETATTDYSATYLKTFPSFSVPRDEDMAALIAGVPYELGRPMYGTSTRPTILIELQPGWLDFTPSRDAVKYNDAKDELTKSIRHSWHRLDHGPAIESWLCTHGPASLAGLTNTLSIGAPRDRRLALSASYLSADDEHVIINDNAKGVHQKLSRKRLEASMPNTTWLFENAHPIPHTVHVERDAIRRTHLYIADKPVIASKISKIPSIESCRPDATTFARTIARAGGFSRTNTDASHDRCLWLCDMPVDAQVADVRSLLRALGAWNVRLHENEPSAADEQVLVLDFHDGTIDEKAMGYLADARRTSMTQIVDEAREQRRLEKTERARDKKRTSAADSDEWRQIKAITCKVPDSPDITEEQLVEMIAMAPSHSYWSALAAHDEPIRSLISSRMSQSLTRVAMGPAHAPLANVALIIGDPSASNARMLVATAAAIALARRHGADIVPATVTHVCATYESKVLKRQSEAAIANGATIVGDFRTTITITHESQLKGGARLFGYILEIPQSALFGDDDMLAAKWATLSTRADLRAAEICARVLSDTDDPVLQTEVVRPLADLFDKAGTTRMDRWAPWIHSKAGRTRPTSYPMSPTGSHVGIIDLSPAAMAEHERQTKAISTATLAMGPLPSVFAMPNHELRDDDVDALRDMIGETLARRARTALDENERQDRQEG